MASRVPVVLLWHMHQPEYRVGGRFRLPWVHLHAIGAYADMAASLEAVPGAKAVVNFSPVLVDQIADLAARLRRAVENGEAVGEALLDALVELPEPGPERVALVRRCLPEHGNPRVLGLPAYAGLAQFVRGEAELDEVAATAASEAQVARWKAISDAELRDLIVLFHLSWLGQSVRQSDVRAQRLLARAREIDLADDLSHRLERGWFDAQHAGRLLELVADVVGGVLDRYGALARAGRIELSMTPYYHPLMPLMLDFESAHDAAPGVPLPPGSYPGGEERVRWHLEEGRRRFERAFGMRPVGCWPSEAAISDVSLNLIAEAGFAWAASSQRVLELAYWPEDEAPPDPGRAYHVTGPSDGGIEPPDGVAGVTGTGGPGGIGHTNPFRCFFRNDELSDRIGFAYKSWPAADAARDFVAALETLAAAPDGDLVLAALDGENPWEWYPDNGEAFLSSVYRSLADHPRLRPATLAELTRDEALSARPLPSLRAGSWVNGQLLTWIGETEKNRLWSLLVDAKVKVDARRADAVFMAEPKDLVERLDHLLGAAEGSDWFWWPGEANPAPAVADFDALFRAHLTALYDAIGEAPPVILAQPLATGVSGPVLAGGTMKASGGADSFGASDTAAPSLDGTAAAGPRESALEPPWVERCGGVLLDVAGLPSGRLGDDAHHFIDFMNDAGLGIWQMLPVGPRDRHRNPFQPASAFAGDINLLPVEWSVNALESFAADGTAGLDGKSHAAYRHFCADNADWLDDWALFVALKGENGGVGWWMWPEPLRDRSPAALEAARMRLAEQVERACRDQFAFDQAWTVLKGYAASRGVKLFGDVPLFVAQDSADIWAHRELFEIGADGQVTATVGVPPDAFSETGQMWGNPPYRWEAIAEQDFAWWRRRFEVQARRFDFLRLDHFRGLAAWWRLPPGAVKAAEGRWILGPGAKAVECLAPVLGGTRLVAEDLGVITPDVVALRRRLGLPGMRVLQFAFDGDPTNPHLPMNHGPDCVCYTGTHDNDTVLGWWDALPEEEREEVRRVLGEDDVNMPQALVDCAWRSVAPMTIVPWQDLLGLGSEARVNRPGVAEGNWVWRFAWEEVPSGLAARLRQALSRQGRLAAVDQDGSR